MKPLHILLILTVLAFLCQACTNPGKTLNNDTLGQKLTGTWKTTGNTVFYEQWKTVADSGLIGRAFSLSHAGDTMYSENLRIDHQGDSLYYMAKVYRQNQGKIIRFALVQQSSNQWVFENPWHDYPNRIVYRFEGDSILHTRAENMEGKKAIVFHMKKL
jgi:hypothetical protein